ncbi:hypothetical protein [Isobaculum melis]|uniref:Uncharacterized protein n=1 Tax=Isobaculum melis TaxID=142588 RepID=A0A1H9QI83_9LACT|nr:hypothetical protein [Isobaculum melis]SER59895.1 hypothetical protein SAMN04488559_10279 [Isobaculum melis]
MSKDLYNYDRTALEDYKKRDRRMMKYQGFFLSEHNEELQQFLTNEQQLAHQVKKEQQSEIDIAKHLELLWKTQESAIFQVNEANLDKNLSIITGKLLGFSDDIIFIQTQHSVESLAIDLLRHIEPLKHLKWFQ